MKINLFSVPISLTSKPQALALIGEWLREYRSVVGSRLSVIGSKSAGFQSAGPEPINRKPTNQKPKTDLPAEERAMSRERIVHEVGEWQAKAGNRKLITGYPKIIVTPNPEIIVAAQSDPALMKALQAADLSIPDGIGVVWALRLLMSKTIDDRKWKVGAEDRKSKIENSNLSSTLYPLPPSSIFNHLSSNINRLSGLDLMESLMSEPPRTLLKGLSSKESPWKVMLLGGRPGIAQAAAASLRRTFNIQHSTFRIESLSGPQNISNISQSENDRLVAQINSFQPDLLFVAFGHPKQEKWLIANRESLTVGVAMAVGGAFDQIADPSLRPPPYINSIGLGWLYRLLRQPWRIKRQLALLTFIYIVAKELFSRETREQ